MGCAGSKREQMASRWAARPGKRRRPGVAHVCELGRGVEGGEGRGKWCVLRRSNDVFQQGVKAKHRCEGACGIRANTRLSVVGTGHSLYQS